MRPWGVRENLWRGRGFLCHVHDRGKAFAENSDKLRQERIAREERVRRLEEARELATRLESTRTTRARSKTKRRGG